MGGGSVRAWLRLAIAAVGEQRRGTALHYDADFDHIASVTGQSTEWVVARGNID